MSRYRCPECGYQYDESIGDRHEGLAPGTLWRSLPQDEACPGCSVRLREDFEHVDAPSPPSTPA